MSLYFRAHLAVRVDAADHRRLPPATAGDLEPLGVTPADLNARLSMLETSKDVAVDFLCREWPPVAAFLACGGPGIMMAVIQASPGERYLSSATLWTRSGKHLTSQSPE